MPASTAISRYNTSDFKARPVMALADLMGLNTEHKRQMSADPDFYGSLLCGVAVHRHLEQREHIDVNRRINHEVPPSSLQSRLRSLIVMQRVQPYWFMWSLSDAELRDFFRLNTSVAKVTLYIFRNRIAARLALTLMLIGFSEAQAKPIDAPDSRLMDYTRVTLSLSLCVATFEQEHKDVRNARRYQEGIVRVDQLMRQGGWDQEEWSRAYEIVLQEDYSFSLSPEATWGSFQREYFTSEFCDDVLEQFNGEKE